MKSQQIRTDLQLRNNSKTLQLQSLNLQQLDVVFGGAVIQVPIKVKHNV